MHLIIKVYTVDTKGNNNPAVSCIPFSGAQVEIWHANSQGVYSSVQQLGTDGKMYLRGYQSTDSNGTSQFNIIYSGWY